MATRDAKKRELRLHYYFDIEKALDGYGFVGGCVAAVDEHRVRERISAARSISTSARRRRSSPRSTSRAARSSTRASGKYALVQAAPQSSSGSCSSAAGAGSVQALHAPGHQLKQETSKEAVCLVFEKVNTGGVPLSVFELVTATWAADGFNLRETGSARPARGRHARLSRRPLLRDLQPTDFLQGVASSTRHERRARISPPAEPARRPRRSPPSASTSWRCRLTRISGGPTAHEGLRAGRAIPAQRRVPPPEVLAVSDAAHTARRAARSAGDRWLEPQIKQKLARWFWSGVFGELYGGAVETRIALDVQHVTAWIEDSSAPEPATVQAASFHPNRLDTLRSRTSAAYRGLYVLLQREGAATSSGRRG